ncbi:DUF4011 domain-containing protein [Phenylobacterium sp.]|uniref:DUF4011 domain-containing protein n=1 Tax=Phenylobacterium sp. TaxID=1871053 RepID=UPI0035AF19AD
MAADGARPYRSWSTEEIEQHLWAFRKDEGELELALDELSLRKTASAQALAEKLRRLKKAQRAEASKERVDALHPETRRFMLNTLEKLRDKLIDISKRNPLIAFKHSERGATFVRVVDELPNELCKSLQAGGMGFDPLPNPDQEPADQTTPAFKLAMEKARLTDQAYLEGLAKLGADVKDEEAAQKLEQDLIARVRESLGLPKLAAGKKLDIEAFARANGFNPSFDLPSPDATGTHFSDKAIRVLYTRDRLEARLRTIYDRYRGHAADLGIHTLQIAFGFIEWREADGEKVAHHAPLLLMPVHLRREVKGGRYVYTLGGDDENLVVNMALQEMLRRNFGVVLPAVSEDDTPEDYFGRVQELFDKAQAKLAIRRFVTIAVLPFPNMAVWQDLDAASWPGQGLLAHPHLQQLLGATGGAAGGSAFPQDYDVEALPDAEVPPLVLPADVSQHSALIDVAASRSLAVEGPPGTGKSQTIANMIAGALDRGRRVLFVAEKRAALEVVARRLEALGFGPLMLELHSERSTKAQVIESLDQRLNSSAPRNGGKLDQTRRDIAERRRLLKLYRSLLRQRVGALEQPVNALIWREMALRGRLESIVDRSIWASRAPYAAEVDELGLLRRREILNAVEGTAEAILGSFGGFDGSRWRAARKAPAQPIGQDQAREDLRSALSALEQLTRSAERLQQVCGASEPPRIGELHEWSQAAEALPDPSGLENKRLRACLDAPEKVRQVIEQLLLWREKRTELEGAHPDPTKADIGQIRVAEAAFARAKHEGRSCADARASFAAGQAHLATIGELAAFVEDVREKLAPGCAGTAQHLRALCLALADFVELDDDTLALRSPALLDETARRRLGEGRELAEKLRAQEQEVARFCDLTRLSGLNVADLEQAAKTCDTTAALLRPFSGAYRAALAQARAVGANPKAGSTELAAGFSAAAALLRGLEEFRANARFTTLFPAGAWDGHRTDFAGAAKLESVIASINEKLETAGLNASTERLISQPARQIRRLAEQARQQQHALDRLEEVGAHGEAFSDVKARLELELAALQEAIRAVESARLDEAVKIGPQDRPSSSFEALQDAGRAVDQLKLELAWFDGASEAVDRLREHLELGQRVLELGLPQPLAASLAAAAAPVEFIQTLRKEGAEGVASLDGFDAAWDGFRQAYEVDEALFFGAAIDNLGAADLEQALQDAIADETGLRLFADFGRYLRAAEDEGVRWLVDAIMGSGKPLVSLADAYELALIRTLLQQLFQSDGSMFERLGGTQLADASNRFVDLDKLLSELEAVRIISERYADKAPIGEGSGPRGGWTDMCLIENEVSKSKRHIPIRDLVKRAHSALQAIKPVWLMSPTSVAQFVPPGTADFDLVLIDEASQMTPEMAVGALGRGKQIIVVGDPKQLPPTNFFRNRSESVEDDEDDDSFDVDNESILDLAFSRLNYRRRLKWHYRSQHADLIQFSNRQFYESELVVFPSPVTSDDFLGVKSRFVGGVYEGRVNAKEAEEVIEALVGLIYARPELTFGVVTMNTQQRELIMQEFDRIRAENKVVADYVQQRENTVDELFIKNLENVQGEERDIILVSTLYGPPPTGGRVLQRFGLFTRKDGHRRLNVLVTRARMATLVFTSLRPTDVVVTETSSQGVRSFREYLAYAEGAAFVDDETGGIPDSDFEEYVAERIRANGYQVVPQVGVEGFRIDLGIKHPAYPSGFLAGVECDGATYHSGLSVRDRDRIRQDVLERLGWRIYRVWSTDWFNDPERETTKLIAWLDRLREKAEASAASRRARETEPLSAKPAAKRVEPPPPTPVTKKPTEQLLPLEPVAQRPNEQLLPLEPASKPAPSSAPEAAPRAPSGKRHAVDGIEFYEEMPGYFEVWIDGAARGSVERLTTAMSAAKVYAGAFQAQKPQFEVTRYWDESTFICDDIYVAVRKLASNYRELARVEA